MSREEIISYIVEAICVIICFLIGRYLIPAIKKTNAYNNMKELVDWIETYTKGVEQTTTEQGAGVVKLEAVTELASAKASELGVTISAEDLRMLIEKCVKAMNEGEKSSTTLTIEK